MRFDVIDFLLNAALWIIGIFMILVLCSVPFAVKESHEFRERCEAKSGHVITGRDIRLCVVDGKIVDGN